jgi:hypothetical protein
MNHRKTLLIALISIGIFAAIGAAIWVFPKKETAKISIFNKNLNKITEEPIEPTQVVFSNQKFSDSNSGITFDFPVSWARPRVIKSAGNTQLIFNNSLEILVTTDTSYKDKVKNESNYTTIVLPVDESPQKNKVVVITYENSSNVGESIDEILDTLGVEESQVQVTLEPTPTVTTLLYPTSYPTSYPTPNPTTFYSESAECTYGCLSENKFQ